MAAVAGLDPDDGHQDFRRHPIVLADGLQQGGVRLPELPALKDTVLPQEDGPVTVPRQRLGGARDPLQDVLAPLAGGQQLPHLLPVHAVALGHLGGEAVQIVGRSAAQRRGEPREQGEGWESRCHGTHFREAAKRRGITRTTAGGGYGST